MGIWEMLLTPLLIAVIFPIVFSFFWFFKVRGEKKISSQEVIRTRPPKIVSGFFLGFALIVLFGGIAVIVYCCITDSENTTASAIIAASVCIAVLSTLGFFGYAYARFNYVVSDAEGILVYRLFRKKRYYSYEEIGCFQDTPIFGLIGLNIREFLKSLLFVSREGTKTRLRLVHHEVLGAYTRGAHQHSNAGEKHIF